MSQFIKWPSIELFHNVLKGVRSMGRDIDFIAPTVSYRASVKIDGSNAGIQIPSNGDPLIPQSHNSVLFHTGHDNYGFAAWVEENKEYFLKLANDKHTVIFGEWSGRSIQSRTAISQIKRRILAVFAIKFNDTYCVEPSKIREFLPAHDDIFVIDWLPDFEISIDFANKDDIEKKVEEINGLVAKVEDCDPWVKSNFGIEGIGEGVVMYPISFGGAEVLSDSDFGYVFKAKGEKHRVVKQPKPVIVDTEKVKTVKEFVDKFVTEQRLAQGVIEACGGEYEITKMGAFLKWVGNDVMKESEDELEVSGLEWSDVAKMVGGTARDWYKLKIKESI